MTVGSSLGRVWIWTDKPFVMSQTGEEVAAVAAAIGGEHRR